MKNNYLNPGRRVRPATPKLTLEQKDLLDSCVSAGGKVGISTRDWRVKVANQLAKRGMVDTIREPLYEILFIRISDTGRAALKGA